MLEVGLIKERGLAARAINGTRKTEAEAKSVKKKIPSMNDFLPTKFFTIILISTLKLYHSTGIQNKQKTPQNGDNPHTFLCITFYSAI